MDAVRMRTFSPLRMMCTVMSGEYTSGLSVAGVDGRRGAVQCHSERRGQLSRRPMAVQLVPVMPMAGKVVSALSWLMVFKKCDALLFRMASDGMSHLLRCILHAGP